MASLKLPPAMLSGTLFAASAFAHGIVTAAIKDDGSYYKGYNPSYQWENPKPVVVQWSTPEDLQNTFIDPSKYKNWDIACHLSATPGGLEIPVKGGDVLNILWNTWPDSHKGPIIDMLAKCDGSCSTADKTKLEFFKISELALIDASSDLWAPNVLVDNGFSWQVTVPSDIESGNYVLRHEIIALHAAGQTKGAQNYPFCLNLAVDNSESGADELLRPDGILATDLYNAEDPGIHYDLFAASRKPYEIPGPPMYPGSNPIITDQKKPPTVRATGAGVEALAAVAQPTAGAFARAEAPTPTPAAAAA